MESGGTWEPRARRRFRLRAYLTGLTALFVVAAVGAIWSGWLWTERDGLAAARADTGYAAGKAAGQLATNLTVVRSTVDAVASNPGAAQVFVDPAACRLAFSLGGADDGHLDILGRDGRVVCSSRPPADAREAAAYVGASWLSAGPRTLGPTPDARTGRPAVLVTAPLPGLGTVVAAVDLVSLGRSVGDVFGGARELEFLITTEDGATVVTRWPDGPRWAGTPVSASRFVPPPDATGDGLDATGTARVYGQATVTGPGWHVYAGADRQAALAGTHRIARRQALIAGIGLLAGLLGTWLVYRRITRPIGRLRAAVHAAGDSGRPAGRVPLDGPREVSELAAEFNRLLATVERELADRREAERRAGELARNYQEMFAASPFPSYLYDVDTLAFVAVNDAAVEFYGYPRDTLLGMQVGDLCPAADVDEVVAGIRGEAGVQRASVQRHVKQDGTVREVKVTSHVTTFDGHPVRCAVVEDVTERERLQQRLHQSERLESLGHLAGGIAHDFNNLLGVINGYAEMSATEVESAAVGDPAWRALHADLLQIVAAGDRATALTRQLLAFARADVVAEVQVLDLADVVTDVKKLLVRTLGEDITLNTSLLHGAPPVQADVGRLEQVLVNLAVNARDAMPTGGTLTIDTDLITVDDHYAAQHPGLRTGQYMRLRVSDTGTGMSRETQERAFEPFFTTKPKGHGTGLGLATIWGIVAQAGGHAQIYSEVGQGTTVAVLLPVTEKTAGPPAPQTTAVRRGTGETILLVEDDDSLRALTERILQRNGYTVLSAATAEQAQRLAVPEQHIDLLLTDVVLPGMHGPDLVTCLRADRPALRVIYMSGYAETILAARSAVPVGATLLNKPVSAHQLLSAIPRTLGSARRAATG